MNTLSCNENNNIYNTNNYILEMNTLNYKKNNNIYNTNNYILEMNTLNYKKNNNIYNTNNYINKSKTQEPCVLTKDPRDLGPDTRLTQNGSWLGLMSSGS
jgi:hypothetical protein